MKADDRFMILMTAVVLIVAVGTIAQKSDTIMAAFGSIDDYEAVEDAFTVRAGRTMSLDVLANDLNVQDGDAERILILQQPVCGTTRRSGGEIEYLNSDACDGRVTFTYCVIQGDACPSAQVVLNVSLSEALPGRDGGALAEAGATGFPTLRAPSLASPDSEVGISAADATASLRNRDFGVTQISRPSQSVGVGLARQESVGVSAGMVSSGFGGTVVDEGSVPSLSRGAAPERVAIARPTAPQLGGGSRVFAPAPPRPTGSTEGTSRLAGLGQPSAPSAPSVGGSGLSASSGAPSRPSIGGSSRPSVGGGLSAPSLGGGQETALASNAPSVAPSRPQISQPSLGGSSAIDGLQVAALGEADISRSSGLSLRTVTSMFRPAEGISSEESGLTTQSSARPNARPTIASAPGLSGDTGVVTERAAQIILPVTAQPEADRSAPRPTAPTTPNLLAMADIALPRRPTITGSGSRTAALTDRDLSLPSITDAPLGTTSAECEVGMAAAAKLGEMVAITVESPCRPNALVTLAYSGIEIDFLTNGNGQLEADLPAFDEVTDIIATFQDGAQGTASMSIRGIDRIARVGIAWQGQMNLDLHAFEYGAAEDEDGHVWEGNARSYRDSRRQGGGYMTRLGLVGGRQLEVYTLPVSRRTASGVVDTALRVSPETDVCDDRVNVLTLYNNQALVADQRTVSIETTGCTANGEAISFASAVRDIDVAQR